MDEYTDALGSGEETSDVSGGHESAPEGAGRLEARVYDHRTQTDGLDIEGDGLWTDVANMADMADVTAHDDLPSMTSFEARLFSLQNELGVEMNESTQSAVKGIWREVEKELAIQESQESGTMENNAPIIHPRKMAEEQKAAMARMHVPPDGGASAEIRLEKAAPPEMSVTADEVYVPLPRKKPQAVAVHPSLERTPERHQDGVYEPFERGRVETHEMKAVSTGATYAPLEGEIKAEKDMPAMERVSTSATYAPLDGIALDEADAMSAPALQTYAGETAKPAFEESHGLPPTFPGESAAAKAYELKPEPMGDLPSGNTVEETYQEAMRLVERTAKKYRRSHAWFWWVFAVLALAAIGYWLAGHLQ